MKQIEVNMEFQSPSKSNKYISYFDQPSLEIFIKVIADDFKGFAIVLHENEDKRIKNHLKSLRDVESDRNLEQDIQRQIRLIQGKHETFKFLTQQEELKNSMVALFYPDLEQEPSIQKKSLSSSQSRGSVDSSGLQFQKIQSINSQINKKTITNLKKHEKLQEKQKKSFTFEVSEFTVLPDDTLLDEFNFNIFEYPSILAKQRIVYAILQRNEFIDFFDIPLQNLSNFLIELQRRYDKRSNPFHNYDHALSVMQGCHYLCLQKKSIELLDDIIRFSTIVSGLCHDVGHRARTNVFEVNSKSKLALRYHDKSPLEQYHAATALLIMNNSASNIVCNLTNESFGQFKRVLVQNILYTDIKEHFNLLKIFETRLIEVNSDANLKFGSSDEDIKLYTGMLLHTADFKGGAMKFEVSRKWSELINVEYMRQFEEEEQLNIPQTPFFKDVDKLHVLAKGEMGFFKAIVKPLWSILNNLMDGSIQISIDNLDSTIATWAKILQENQPPPPPKVQETNESPEKH